MRSIAAPARKTVDLSMAAVVVVAVTVCMMFCFCAADVKCNLLYCAGNMNDTSINLPPMKEDIVLPASVRVSVSVCLRKTSRNY